MFEKGSIIFYEIFNNLLSGIPILIAINISNYGIQDSLINLSKINFIVLTGFTFFIGTIVHSASTFLYSFSIRKLNGVDEKSKKHINLRKLDKDNWNYIEKWYTLSNSYFSLALSLILSLLYLLIIRYSIPIVALIIIILSILLLIVQSMRYARWAKKDLENAFSKIDCNG